MIIAAIPIAAIPMATILHIPCIVFSAHEKVSTQLRQLLPGLPASVQ